jgi:tetratricopeptide (TPR) repeat protein
MSDVFVSYASQDRERIVPLVEAIERGGWSVWWDREIGAGSAFDREIEKAIDQARCIVVVWTAGSVESDWVRNEATEGLERGVLLPVLIDAVRPPLAFRRTQTIDLSSDGAVDPLLNAISQFVPVSAAEDPDESMIVGRDAELSRVAELVGNAARGSGGFVLLCGEAGVGKTRLGQETAVLARNAGMLTLSGYCLEIDGAPPYHPLIQQIEQANRMVDAGQLRAALGENAPEMAKLMPELRQYYSDIAEPISLPPDQERRYLLHGCGEFIARAAEAQPMLLTFEDLHWADESTCVLLRHLAERLQDEPVLMLGSYRDDELESGSPFARTLQELVRERRVEEIRLRRLDVADVTALLESRAGQRPPERLVSLIFSETEGNPFFVEELYRHLEETGKLFDDEGRFRTEVSVTDTEVPRSVRLVLEQRLERVSDPCRSLLTVAAVVGRLVSYEQLARLSDLEGEPLFDALEEAEAALLMEDVSVGREVRYQFVHEQIRQTLLGTLSIPRRQRFHLRVATALEESLGAKAEQSAGEIAYHLYQAGAAADSERTFKYLSLASQRALDALAFEDALKQLDMALEVIEPDNLDGLGRVHAMRGFALRGAARIDDALAALAAGIELGEQVDNYTDLLLQCSELLVDLYRGAEALAHLQRLLDIAKARADVHLEMHTQALLGKAHYSLSLDQAEHAQLALDASNRTIELAREVHDQKELARALIASAHFVDYWEDFRPQASKNLSEAKAIGELLGDEDVLLDCDSMGLRVQIFVAVEYELHAEEIRQRLEERRDPIRLKEHLFWMILPTRAAGQLERSVEICEQAIELAARLDVPPVQYPTFKAVALTSLGRFGEAWQSLQQEVAHGDYRFGAALQRYGFLEFKRHMGAVDDVLAEAGPLFTEADALNRLWMVDGISDILTHAAIRAGRLVEAQALLAEFSGIGARLSKPVLAEVALAEGDVDAALTAAKSLRANHADNGRKLLAADASELIIRCFAAQSRWQEVIEQADSVIAFCDEAGYRNLAWRVLAARSQARRALELNTEAQADLARAGVLLRELADTIEQPDMRQSFESQPIVRDVLAETL